MTAEQLQTIKGTRDSSLIAWMLANGAPDCIVSLSREHLEGAYIMLMLMVAPNELSR